MAEEYVLRLTSQIVSILSSVRIPLHSESIAQATIAGVLGMAKITWDREVKLDSKNRIDLMVGDIGIEVKLKGNAKSIYKQCERYCQFERVQNLILVTNRTIGFPPTINNKPCFLVILGRSWL